MLRLERKSRAPGIDLAALAMKRAVEEVASVELDARFRGKHFQHTAALRIPNASSKRRRSGHMVEDEVMVVAFAEFQLLVIVLDTLSNRSGLPEVERRPVHVLD